MKNYYKFIIAFFIIFFADKSFATNHPQYASSLIKKELLSKADIVIRDEAVTVGWEDIDEVTITKKLVVTIMNKDGMNRLLFYEQYDNNTKITKLRASILDKNGNTIKEYKKNKFSDRAIVSGLYTDSRYKFIKPVSNTFPFTVIFLSEIKSNNSLYFPRWQPLLGNYEAVENSEYTFSNPNNYKFNYIEKNVKSQKNSNGDLVWKVKDIKASTPESFGSSKKEYLPFVDIAPESFIYEGIVGNFSNWKEYGSWFYEKLMKQQNNLTQKQKYEIVNLMDDEDSDIEKAKKIYHHLQEKMRYVSVQVGIGGIQPISAKEVAECGYGDCKGLTNYTMAALEVVGIESIYTEVKSGDKKYDYEDNFASITQGDHIILCLPNIAKDTLWLECTSKDSPFGYLGNFTDDRKVLLITDKGGIITKTPDYSEYENSIIRKVNVIIDQDGKINGKSISEFSGNMFNEHLGIEDISIKKRQVILAEVYSNNMQVDEFELIKTDSLLSIENLKFSISNEGALLTDKTFMFNPYILENTPIELYRNRNRKSDIVIERDYVEVDSINYKLPKHSKVEAVPSNVFIDNDFGTYVRFVTKKDKTLIYYRKFSLKKGIYPKEEYKEFYKFIRKVKRADNAKVMMYL